MFQFRRLLARYQPFIFPLSLLVAAVCIVVFVVFPAVGQTLQQFEQVSSLREQVSILEQKVSVLNNLDESSLEQNVALTTSAVPIDKSLPTILSTLEGLSEKTGVVLKSLVMDAPGAIGTQSATTNANVPTPPPQQTTEGKKIGASSVSFSVTLSGTFEQIKTFLAASNKVRRIVKAKSFTLNFAEEQLTTQISFEAFYAPLAKRNDTEALETLKNKDFDLLATLEQFPNMTINGSSAVISTTPTELKENPFAQ